MAGFYAWATRCIPALSICLVLALSFFGFVVSPFGKIENGDHAGEATVSQLVLTGYILFLHVLSVVYPLRACCSVRDVTKRMKETATLSPSSQSEPVPAVNNEKGEMQSAWPIFAIILPAYKEEVSTLEETLRVLASHPRAHQSYHVR